MQLRYYAETDTLYIAFTEAAGADSREVSPGVVVDLDAEGQAVGIEIEDASTRVDLSAVQAFSLPALSHDPAVP
jgi:uncharacterized protein YuzE